MDTIMYKIVAVKISFIIKIHRDNACTSAVFVNAHRRRLHLWICGVAGKELSRESTVSDNFAIIFMHKQRCEVWN